MADIGDLWRRIQEANRAWTTGDPHQVEKLFHESVVMAVDGPPERYRGREAVVRTYVETRQRIEILGFEELDHAIDEVGNVAVVTYRFRLKYEANGSPGEEVGREILVFSVEKGHWLAIWRTRVTEPSPVA